MTGSTLYENYLRFGFMAQSTFTQTAATSFTGKHCLVDSMSLIYPCLIYMA